MNRLIAGIIAITLVGMAVLFSRQQAISNNAETNKDLVITTEEKNPWTNLNLNNGNDQFQFAIVSDRTGGHRAKIFSQAVQRLNLMQPEFVISVGDLVEGYTTKQEQIDAEWKELNGFVNQLQMPFFYLPGNHDLTNKTLNENWKNRFGRTYFHFVYKNVLFLCINSEDGKASTIGEDQLTYFKKVLEDNKDVRWTLGFLHKPLWAASNVDTNGWGEFEKLLAGRKHNVFCGHVHRYQEFERNGTKYYQLATTGGGSRIRGPEYGEFDQIVWMTMKNDGPVFANVLLNGILPPDLKDPESDEPGVARKLPKVLKASGRVTLEGQPLAGATVAFYAKETMPIERRRYVADGFTDADGFFVPTTVAAFDGLPIGEYIVTVIHTGKYGRPGPNDKNTLPEKYASATTSPLTFNFDGNALIKIELSK